MFMDFNYEGLPGMDEETMINTILRKYRSYEECVRILEEKRELSEKIMGLWEKLKDCVNAYENECRNGISKND